MKKRLLLQFIFSLSITLIFSQPPSFQMGFMTSNLVTLPNAASDIGLAQGKLIRYKAGLLCRSTLSETFKPPKPFPKVKKGMAALDYGVNVVAKGYYYSFEQFERSQDQWAIEVPLLVTLYDRDDRWLKRKHRRKGFATFARMGPKFVFELPTKLPAPLTQQNLRLSESGNTGGFNFFWNIGGGILQNTKKGNTFSFHIGWNAGFIKTTELNVEYADEIGPLGNFKINNKGSYLETAMIYLFDPRNIFKGKGVDAPVIFNTRY